MTIPPHTIRPCQLICCFLQSQHVHQLHCIPLVHQLYTAHCPQHRSFCSSQTTLFSLKHHVSLPYNIAFAYLSFYLQKESFSKQYLSILSEFLLSHSCSCSYWDFTSSTDIQPVAKIAKPLFQLHHTLLPVTLFSYHSSFYYIYYKQTILPHLKLLAST